MITSVLALVIISLPISSGAQQAAKVPRIGFLHYGHSNPHLESFLQGLRQLGYVEGQNLIIEYRYAEGKLGRLPELAADLVRHKVNVIVTASGPVTRAAKKATTTIPIVMASSSHPVEDELVASLDRPGGNITGLTSLTHELSGKRLEFLREAMPRISRVAIITTQDHFHVWTDKVLEASQALGVLLQVLKVRDTDEIKSAFAAMIEKGADALIVIPNPMLITNRKLIVELAAKNRLPAIYPQIDYVEAGGLMYYGANEDDLFRRAASFVDKILKGAKPAELPVAKANQFRLGINLKAAKEIGVTISPEFLIRADTVIK